MSTCVPWSQQCGNQLILVLVALTSKNAKHYSVFPLLYVTITWISTGFGLFASQNKSFQVVTLGFWRTVRHFSLFSDILWNWHLVYNEPCFTYCVILKVLKRLEEFKIGGPWLGSTAKWWCRPYCRLENEPNQTPGMNLLFPSCGQKRKWRI